jgi:hypothetical protein
LDSLAVAPRDQLRTPNIFRILDAEQMAGQQRISARLCICGGGSLGGTRTQLRPVDGIEATQLITVGDARPRARARHV